MPEAFSRLVLRIPWLLPRLSGTGLKLLRGRLSGRTELDLARNGVVRTPLRNIEEIAGSSPVFLLDIATIMYLNTNISEYKNVNIALREFWWCALAVPRRWTTSGPTLRRTSPTTARSRELSLARPGLLRQQQHSQSSSAIYAIPEKWASNTDIT